jgi:hypothetical protein
VIVFALPSLYSSIQFDRLLTVRDTRLLAADWLAGRIKTGDTVFESGASYARPLYAVPDARLRVTAVDLVPGRGVFVTSAGGEVQPDWVVLAESPLRLYTSVAPELRGILSSGYRLVQSFPAAREPEPEAAFDRQDAFFLPYADFRYRERPGPALSIYERIATKVQ